MWGWCRLASIAASLEPGDRVGIPLHRDKLDGEVTAQSQVPLREDARESTAADLRTHDVAVTQRRLKCGSRLTEMAG